MTIIRLSWKFLLRSKMNCPISSTEYEIWIGTRRSFSSEYTSRTFAKNFKEFKKTDSGKWIFLVFPISAFGLGTWQIQRKMWKDGLEEELKFKPAMDPLELPEDLSQLSNMEYRPVLVKGTFIHDKELYMGPRSYIDPSGKSSSEGSLFSSSKTGYQVVTPLKLSDRDLTILVNRGWVPSIHKSPNSRLKGQIEGEVEFLGLVRLHENRPPLVMANRPDSGIWLHRDLQKMSEITGAAPVFVDALESSSVPGGPLGGQTRVALRNEHLSYIITWYGLAAVTGFMWYRRFH